MAALYKIKLGILNFLNQTEDNKSSTSNQLIEVNRHNSQSKFLILKPGEKYSL